MAAIVHKLFRFVYVSRDEKQSENKSTNHTENWNKMDINDIHVGVESMMGVASGR